MRTFSLVLLGLALTAAFSSQPARAQGKLLVLCCTTVPIDLERGSGEGSFAIKNETNQPATLTVSACSLARKDTQAAASGELRVLAEDQHKSHPEAPGEAVSAITINPGAISQVHVWVSNIRQPGDYEAQIVNGSLPLGKISVLSAPFDVYIDPRSGDHKYVFRHNYTTSVWLANADPVEYKQLYWGLFVDGQKVANAEKPIALLPGGGAQVQIKPAMLGENNLGSGFFDGIFACWKASPRNASLVLAWDADLNRQIKSLPLQANVTFLSPAGHQLAQHGLTLLVLLAGAFAWLYLSQAVPNKRRKYALRNDLKRLDGKLAVISMATEDKLKIFLRVEIKRLMDLLNSTFTWFPDYAQILDAVEKNAAVVETRLTLLQRYDVIKSSIAAHESTAIPSCLYELTRILNTVGHELSAPEFDDNCAQRASKCLTDAQDRFAKLTSTDLLIANLTNRTKEVQKDLRNIADSEQRWRSGQPSKDAPAPSPRRDALARVRAQLPGPFDESEICCQEIGEKVPDDLSEAKLRRYDFLLYRMNLLVDYLRLANGSTKEALARLTDPTKDKEDNEDKENKDSVSHETHLLSLLAGDSLVNISSALELLAQMREDVYPSRLSELLEMPEVPADVLIDPAKPEPYQPVEVSFKFRDPLYDNVAASSAMHCEWNFAAPFLDIPTPSESPESRWFAPFRSQPSQQSGAGRNGKAWHYYTRNGQHTIRVEVRVGKSKKMFSKLIHVHRTDSTARLRSLVSQLMLVFVASPPPPLVSSPAPAIK